MASTTGSPGSSPCESWIASGQMSCTSMLSAPSSSAESVGRHGLVVVGAHRDPPRSGAGSRHPRSGGAAGRCRWPAARRPSGSHRPRPRRERDVGAVVRGAQRQHPSYDGRAALVPHEHPRDHSPGGVADHVDGLGAGPSMVRSARSDEPAGLHPQVARTALGRLEGDDRRDPRGGAARRAGRGRWPCRRTPGPRSRHPAGTGRAASLTADTADDGDHEHAPRPRTSTIPIAVRIRRRRAGASRSSRSVSCWPVVRVGGGCPREPRSAASGPRL